LKWDGYDLFQITILAFASRDEKTMKYLPRSLVPGQDLNRDCPKYKFRVLVLLLLCQHTSSEM
jgi:hypothetical protein